MEIDHRGPDPPFMNKMVDVPFHPEATGDFPVGIQVSKKHGILYLVTKYGFVHLYDLESGTHIYMNQIFGETIFVTAPHEASHGIITINRKGQVLSVNIDENTFLNYILVVLGNTELAFKLARRANLPGTDDLYIRRYQRCIESRLYNEAARIAADSPRASYFAPLSQIFLMRLPL